MMKISVTTIPTTVISRHLQFYVVNPEQELKIGPSSHESDHDFTIALEEEWAPGGRGGEDGMDVQTGGMSEEISKAHQLIITTNYGELLLWQAPLLRGSRSLSHLILCPSQRCG